MDELTSDWTLGPLLIIAACLYAFLKSLILVMLCYIPAQYCYQRFLKGDQVVENFFKAFFLLGNYHVSLESPNLLYKNGFKSRVVR